MVKIRLLRTGVRNRPSYRIVAVDARKKRDGRVIENLGYYDPKTKPITLSFRHDRVKDWLAKGAQPTDIVRKLINQNEKTH